MILKMKYYSGRQVHNIITETIAGKTLADVLERFAKEPSADVQEIRRGRWIEQEADMDTIYECSVCGEPFVTIEGTPADNLWNYCPSCGARMDKEENE